MDRSIIAAEAIISDCPSIENICITSPIVPKAYTESTDLSTFRDRGIQNDAHIIPSCPGCLPTRLILRISSSVTSSLLNNPPWTTKNRLRPSGDKIALSFVKEGSDAETSVASGTSECQLINIG